MAMTVCLLALGSLLGVARGQAVTQQDDDPVTIAGTWASGSGQVETGLVSAPRSSAVAAGCVVTHLVLPLYAELLQSHQQHL